MVRSSDDGHVIAHYSPLIIVCFRRQAAMHELELMEKLTADAIAEGAGTGMLFVSARQDMAAGIDAPRRAIFERLIKKNAERMGASAVVILIDGFGGAVARSFLIGLLQLTTRRKMIQVCSSIDEACRWLAPKHGLDASALARAYVEATAHFT